MICLRRVMDVWHKSIRQCSQDIAGTLIACNACHRRLTWGYYIVDGQSGCCRMVVSLIVIVVSCSNVAHLILTFFLIIIVIVVSC